MLVSSAGGEACAVTGEMALDELAGCGDMVARLDSVSATCVVLAAGSRSSGRPRYARDEIRQQFSMEMGTRILMARSPSGESARRKCKQSLKRLLEDGPPTVAQRMKALPRPEN